MKKILSGLVLLLAAGGATALFYSEEAAKPGPLLEIHGQLATCDTCHQPWKGVRDSACRQCHSFSNVRRLRPAIRFHEAERHCLKCHTEHRGRKGQIADMDHTLLHPDLLCSQCHFDTHAGLFGQNCRECHGITSWNIENFQHPPREKRSAAGATRPPSLIGSLDLKSAFCKHMSGFSLMRKPLLSKIAGAVISPTIGNIS